MDKGRFGDYALVTGEPTLLKRRTKRQRLRMWEGGREVRMKKPRLRDSRPMDTRKMKEEKVPRKGKLYCVGKLHKETSQEDFGPIPLLSTREHDTTLAGHPAKAREWIAEIWDGEAILFLGAKEKGRYWLVGYQDMFGYLEIGKIIFLNPMK